MPIAIRKHILTAALASSFLMLSACSKQSAAQEHTIKTSAPMNEALSVPSGHYTMDKTHGYVTFSYLHKGLSHPQLRFNNIDSTLVLDAEHPENSQIDVIIQAANIDSGVEKFDTHLKSPDFFNAAVNPQIRFTSTHFTRVSATTGTMVGDLTMMGITKPIQFDVSLVGTSKEAIGVEGVGTVLRSDFKLGKYVPAVGDEVSIAISAEFHKNKD